MEGAGLLRRKKEKKPFFFAPETGSDTGFRVSDLAAALGFGRGAVELAFPFALAFALEDGPLEAGELADPAAEGPELE